MHRNRGRDRVWAKPDYRREEREPRLPGKRRKQTEKGGRRSFYIYMKPKTGKREREREDSLFLLLLDRRGGEEGPIQRLACARWWRKNPETRNRSERVSAGYLPSKGKRLTYSSLLPPFFCCFPGSGIRIVVLPHLRVDADPVQPLPNLSQIAFASNLNGFRLGFGFSFNLLCRIKWIARVHIRFHH